MTRSGQSVQAGRKRGADLQTCAAPLGLSGHEEPIEVPYGLLWCTGIAAVVLCLAALVLWGGNGPGILVGMMSALCI